MPDDLRLLAADLADLNRPGAMAFVTDAASEQALRDGLADALQDSMEVRRGGVRAAIAAQQKMTTPGVLVVDVSGEDHPLLALSELSELVEPDTCVLVIGESADLSFYREITRGLCAAEYLAKPLTRDLVAQHFGVHVRGHAPAEPVTRGGRFITVTGARGGVGASVIAAHLAWHLGTVARRHTLLLDSDLHLGTAAFLLNTQPSPGLRTALEAPERIDALLAERAATPVADRLHVLSGQEPLSQETDYAPGAAEQLLAALRRRYNFIIGDVRWQPLPFCRELLAGAQHRVLVMSPTLAAVRDAMRMMPGNTLPGGGNQQRPTLVLNRLGVPGGLKRAQIEDILKAPIDLVIPDLPRQVGHAVTMGDPAAAQSGAFRAAIVGLAAQVGALGTAAAGGKPSGLRALFGLGRY
jgi:pilus assembly protein CpaE